MSGNVTNDPPAEPALRVDTREELVYLLGQACAALSQQAGLGALAWLTGQAAVDEAGHRGPRLQNGRPAAAARGSQAGASLDREGGTSP
jgi:hypothetical protein